LSFPCAHNNSDFTVGNKSQAFRIFRKPLLLIDPLHDFVMINDLLFSHGAWPTRVGITGLFQKTRAKSMLDDAVQFICAKRLNTCRGKDLPVLTFLPILFVNSKGAIKCSRVVPTDSKLILQHFVNHAEKFVMIIPKFYLNIGCLSLLD